MAMRQLLLSCDWPMELDTPMRSDAEGRVLMELEELETKSFSHEEWEAKPMELKALKHRVSWDDNIDVSYITKEAPPCKTWRPTTMYFAVTRMKRKEKFDPVESPKRRRTARTNCSWLVASARRTTSTSPSATASSRCSAPTPPTLMCVFGAVGSDTPYSDIKVWATAQRKPLAYWTDVMFYRPRGSPWRSEGMDRAGWQHDSVRRKFQFLATRLSACALHGAFVAGKTASHGVHIY